MFGSEFATDPIPRISPERARRLGNPHCQMTSQSRGVHLEHVNPTDTSEGEPDVDIIATIAIHGLDMKSPDTWVWQSKDSNEPNVNWLADSKMLPAKNYGFGSSPATGQQSCFKIRSYSNFLNFYYNYYNYL